VVTRADGRAAGVAAPGKRAATRITILFALVVLIVSAAHEPWRDEVVPLSIARNTASLREMIEQLRFEGHPILWYLILRDTYAIVGQTWVLKIASVGSAIGAIVLFMRSPLALWLKTLFAFSFVPLYQMSVVSRPYGLGMLLLFAFCSLYPRRRERPIALALVLAALTNTHLFGAILALAAGASLLFEAVWSGWDWRGYLRDRRLVCAVGVYVVGLALAAAVALPDPSYRGTNVAGLGLEGIAERVMLSIEQPAAHAGWSFIIPAPSVWAWAYFVYLIPRPALLCFAAAATIGMEVFFRVVVLPTGWNVGALLLVAIATMWMDASGSTPAIALSPRLDRVRHWLGRLLAAAITVVLVGHVLMALVFVRAELTRDHSANRRLAQAIHADPSLANAVVISEPEWLVTSLPYYADNTIYLPREGVFRSWLRFGPRRRVASDLDALLAAAREVHAQCSCPVIVAMGWDVQPGVYKGNEGTPYEETFTITPAARDAFLAGTRHVADLRQPTITDERYDVYVVR